MIAVLVIVGVIAVSASSKLIPSNTFQMQSSRDLIVTAFFSAQQKAMSQSDAIRVITTSDDIDIRQDENGDGSFSAGESIFFGGVQYPVSLLPNQDLTAAIFDYDRLGYTSSQTLTLSQSGTGVNVNVTQTGYSY